MRRHITGIFVGLAIMVAPCFAATPSAHKSTASHSASAKASSKPASTRTSSPKAATGKSVSSHFAASKTASSKSARGHALASQDAPQKATTATGRHSRKGATLKTVAVRPKSKGQQAIDRQRTLEIQEALIRERYLSGEPTGVWDQSTRDAFTRIQDENHWQTKIVPDSRALIKLGLGPERQNLLTPDSADLATPPPPRQERSASGGTN